MLRAGETSGGLTVLLTDDKHTASKLYAKNGKGFYKVKDYNLGFLFRAEPFDADNLEQLAEIVTDLRRHGQAVIVRGMLDDTYYERKARDPDYRITRRKRREGRLCTASARKRPQLGDDRHRRLSIAARCRSD